MWFIIAFHWTAVEYEKDIIYIVCSEALKVARLSETNTATVIVRCDNGNYEFHPPKSLLGHKAPWVVIRSMPNSSIQLRTDGEAMRCNYNCPTLCFKQPFKQFSLSKRDSCPTFSSFL